ncbi:MAG: DUF4124 domain-containing protein [Burkholderiales bacterium]|nr:DUF4124 domain-containing protein [Burkholderiales bacterium]
MQTLGSKSRSGQAHGLRVLWASVCLLSSLGASAAGIYTCVDSQGKRHTSDRPIVECLDREQRVLNNDGSQKQVMPPRMNAEERAAAEEREHQRQAQEAALKDATRRDRNLMMRYPNEAVHTKARDAALDDLHNAIKTSELRVAELQTERKPLEADAEFYKGKRLPLKLRTKLEANDAAQQAQKDLIQGQKAEIIRINALYDAELTRLKRLWAGAAPGSVPDPSASGASAATPAASSGVNRPASSSKAR